MQRVHHLLHVVQPDDAVQAGQHRLGRHLAFLLVCLPGEILHEKSCEPLDGVAAALENAVRLPLDGRLNESAHGAPVAFARLAVVVAVVVVVVVVVVVMGSSSSSSVKLKANNI